MRKKENRSKVYSYIDPALVHELEPIVASPFGRQTESELLRDIIEDGIRTIMRNPKYKSWKDHHWADIQKQRQVAT